MVSGEWWVGPVVTIMCLGGNKDGGVQNSSVHLYTHSLPHIPIQCLGELMAAVARSYF